MPFVPYIVKTVKPGDVVTVRVQHSDHGIRHGVVGRLRKIRLTPTGARVYRSDGLRVLPGREFTYREASVFRRTPEGGGEPEMWAETYDHLPARRTDPAPPSTTPLPECCAQPMRLDEVTQAWVCRTETWHVRPFFPDGADTDTIAAAVALLNEQAPDARGQWHALATSGEEFDHHTRAGGHWRDVALWQLTELGARGARSGTLRATRMTRGVSVPGHDLADVAEQIAQLFNNGNASQAWWYARAYPASTVADTSQVLARLNLSLLTGIPARTADLNH